MVILHPGTHVLHDGQGIVSALWKAEQFQIKSSPASDGKLVPNNKYLVETGYKISRKSICLGERCLWYETTFGKEISDSMYLRNTGLTEHTSHGGVMYCGLIRPGWPSLSESHVEKIQVWNSEAGKTFLPEMNLFYRPGNPGKVFCI